MTPEFIAVLSVWVASFLGLAGLMLTLLQALEQGQAELKGIVDVIRESLFQRNVS
jgi:hypothetical protein